MEAKFRYRRFDGNNMIVNLNGIVRLDAIFPIKVVVVLDKKFGK
jgi:hypothetical protein